MKTPEQTELFAPIAQPPEPRVVYVPPAVEVIDQFAREVCDHLAERGKAGCKDREVVDGFAGFLNFVAELTASHLNQQNKVREGV